MDDELRERLLAMAAEDAKVRAGLAADGPLLQGYHPRMAEAHRRNAAELAGILARHGWPGESLVGEDGAHAAWLILQHAIGDPPLQRRGLELLREAATLGEVSAWQAALVEDRVRFFEGRPQRFGTQLDWDAEGRLGPGAIEDPGGVDGRRRSVGLPSLGEDLGRKRAGAAQAAETPPRDRARRQREMAAWALSVGWRA